LSLISHSLNRKKYFILYAIIFSKPTIKIEINFLMTNHILNPITISIEKDRKNLGNM